MKLYYGLSAFLALLFACQSPGQRQPAAGQQDDSTGASATPPAPSVYYKRLKGALAGQPVTMHLIRTGPAAFDAWYAYDKQGIPIQLFHNVTDSTQLSFTEYTTPDEDNTFKGILSANDTYKGTWAGKNRSYDFELREDTTGAVLFQVFTSADSVRLLPTHPKSPLGLAVCSMVWPVGGADGPSLALIKKALTPLGAPEEPEKIVRQPIDTFLRDYKAVRDDVDTSELNKGTGASWNWDAQTETRVVWNTWPLLVLEHADYSFTGGAHGNYGSNYTVLDLARQKVLQVSDVFKPGSGPALGAALEKAFRKKYAVPAKDPLNKRYLFEPHIQPNNNFYITDKGAVFNYMPYEIAAYAVGQITLFVPFEEVKNYVNEAYLK
ncbi:hypothetical protein DLD77_07995 [Chitinophaga alhagiae]|uniref:DUF3298 domain-containing protein n=1 Tax=Chitinophaga alhagiae TaxID=2203219 RepID=A0ABM6WCD8_9BACT|nr:DUF3298 and DUF4163 domain-containing protein [Chitinophaga alhagiae]AWO01640.1 hypothetical protein DLD77_07995 [Chitinophaga alhagiae]